MDDFVLTYEGPPVDDVELLERAPPALVGVLQQVNGFIQFGGGLHVRGACRQPTWHSLREAWLGDEAFHGLYPDVVRPPDGGSPGVDHPSPQKFAKNAASSRR